MGSAAKKPNFMTYGSPIKEEEHEGEDLDHYAEPDSSTGCGCFRLFGFGLSRRNGNESRHLLQEGGRCSGMAWWSKKMCMTSEVLAGPKWKNFIRKIGGYWKGKKERNRFQYDPHSYALNFDGGGNGREEEENLLLGFSARFAAPFGGENRHTVL